MPIKKSELYTSGALDGYDQEDVAGLLGDRYGKAKEDLEEAQEAIKTLCEPVDSPKARWPICVSSAPNTPGTPSS